MPGEIGTFLRSHFGRAPYAQPARASGSVPLFTWEVLDGILKVPEPIDMVTVQGGRLVPARPPRSLADVQEQMRAGVSVVIRGAERHDPGLAALASSFAASLPGEVHIQLYATPSGTNSYGWHYDFEDVFIAQTLGVKDYYFRDNTVARDVALGETLDFTRVHDESSPLLTSRLLAGDWLYIPARWWHLVKCVEDSLSISVGVMPIDALRTARRLPRGWSGVPDEAGPSARTKTV